MSSDNDLFGVKVKTLIAFITERVNKKDAKGGTRLKFVSGINMRII